MSDTAMSVPLLTRLGNYELVRLLAQGGMADIYLARQAGLDRHVAVKVLNRQRAADPDACTLFLDEARLCAMLSHENLAGVHEVAAEGGVHYLALEYVHGVDLRELLAAAQKASCAIAYDTAVAIIAGAATVEVSGGVRFETLRDFALPGVDVISVGALTHSAVAVDLSLTILPAG
jgi:hypothetical protein